MPVRGLTAAISERALRPVPREASLMDRARLLLCDYLMVAAAGAAAESSNVAREALVADEDGDALLEGSHGTVSRRTAALLNGISAHALELDDTYEPGSLHPGVAVWPAILALSDRERSSADDVLEAAIVGYDVACEVAVRVGGARAYARGFHPTGTCGVFGAAAAAGRLLDLDLDQMQWALGIAATAASGSMEYLTDGAWTKRLNPGLAATNGLTAALLASRGFIGPRTALEGTAGFLRSYGGATLPAMDDVPIPAGDGIRRTSVKFYPCCRYMHANLDLLLDLVREEDIDPDEIEEIGCGVLSAGRALVADPPERKRDVRSEVDAQFSMAYGAALAVATRHVAPEDFRRAPEHAARFAGLMSRVQCITSSALDARFPDQWGGEVWIRTADGRRFERCAPSPRGSPDVPPSWDDVRSKGAAILSPPLADRVTDECLAFGGSGPARHALSFRTERTSGPP